MASLSPLSHRQGVMQAGLVLPGKALLWPAVPGLRGVRFGARRAVLEFSDLGRRKPCKVDAVRQEANVGIPRRSRRSGQREGVVLAADKSTVQTPSSTENRETVATVAEDFSAPPQGYIGSPLLWIGVGVGLSVLFNVVSNRIKKYAMQQVFKTMVGQSTGMPGMPGMSGVPGFPGMPMGGPGSPFPFPPMPSTAPQSPPQASTFATAPPTVGPFVDVETSSKPQGMVDPVVTTAPSAATASLPKPPVFSDVSASTIEEEKSAAAAAAAKAAEEAQQPKRPFFKDSEVVDNGVGWNINAGPSLEGTDGKSGSAFSVQALERMMEDPMVQKMVYPYLPEEMRNPTTFKWMMQNPQFRQQLQDMLNNIGGDGAWDNRMSEMLKNFDLNSSEVKQQFEQIGLTPEEVVAKIMANPDVALAFQNPRVQAAIMDCSQNPLNITKYQNDKEVMDVFNKISELFPGMSSAPY